jgi:predicted nucleic acid-binding protein
VLLVDTSVWIEVFRKPAGSLSGMPGLDEIVTCLPVVQEVLQGFRDERAFRTARESLLAFPVVESPLAEAVFIQAAELYRGARRAGLTVRSSTDCLVAACALRNDLTVLHVDRDYDALARVSALRVERL